MVFSVLRVLYIKSSMKRVVIMLFSLAVPLSVFPQDKINTGLNIGYVSSTFIGNDIPGKGVYPVSSAIIGGYFRYRFNNKYSVQPEINFYSKGSKINTIDNLYEYVYLNYLEIPVLFTITFRDQKKLQPIIFAGPALDINTNASGSRGYLNDVRKIDVGIITGTGIEIWKLSLRFRYCYSLTRFDKSIQELDLRNSALSVSVGFNFVNKMQK